MEGGPTAYSSAMAPSGSYVLIVVSQPVSEQHKKTILDRLNAGLLSWDIEATGCDLTGLKTACSSVAPEHLDECDVLIQHSTESLGVEVLVNPTVSTLKQCVGNFLSTSTGHKHLINAGYAFAGSGSWILQNGTFSADDFLGIFQQANVRNQKKCTIHMHCAKIGLWESAKMTGIDFNPPKKVDSVPGSEFLIDCLERVLIPQALEDMMEGTSLVGNIRFNRPTLYLFPAGQGDCALFGVNGFNMLIDGGFNRKPCSWEFIRHLDRLDAVLVTRLCENNVCGMSTLMKRKSLNNTYPKIGYVFCNIAEGRLPSPDKEFMGVGDADDLIVSVVREGHDFTNTLNELKLKPHQCWRDSTVEPFVLYHKVGHGTVEMHVLSPPKDSKEMKEFLIEWSSYKETFSKTKSGLKNIPLSHSTSICAVIVWRPDDPKDTITRILFPGSAPQGKILDSLEKLKAIDVFKQPVVTKSSLTVVTKSVSSKTEKTASRAQIPNRKITSSPAHSVSSVASKNGDVNGVKKEVKRTVKEVKKDIKIVKKDPVIKEIKKENKVDGVGKKEIIPKEKKEVKKIVKKEVKDLKTADKKSDLKTKKTDVPAAVSKHVTEAKKTAASALKKSSSPVRKSPSTPKTTETKKAAAPKSVEPKATKDASNKKAAETKAVAKTKPKAASSSFAKTAASSKAMPTASPKHISKLTKASVVAATSIVASAVAVPIAAMGMNEKKEEMINKIESQKPSEDVPPVVESKEDVCNKLGDVQTAPTPPEALSPTPSESISLTQSDTLSSAPLETVSPTPPPANEPIEQDFTEEKDVNEVKDIELDPIPCETVAAEENIEEFEKLEADVNEVEVKLAQHQQTHDVMSTSFIGSKEMESPENEISPKIDSADHFQQIESVPESFEIQQAGQLGKEEDGAKETIDSQLEHLSMEGSFCAGYEHEKPDISAFQTEDTNIEPTKVENYGYPSEVKADIHAYNEEILKPENKEFEESKTAAFDSHTGRQFEIKEPISQTYATNVESKPYGESHFDLNTKNVHESHKYDSEYLAETVQEDQFDYQTQEQYDRITDLGQPSRVTDNYPSSHDIIADDEMQETSVDEPEEIVRKESAVSITLNEGELDVNLSEQTPKSGAESEDDVDIQKYMAKESLGRDKIQNDDSDHEDIVKSPSPHDVINYGGRIDDADRDIESPIKEDESQEKEVGYTSEKQDLNEKDHDSAEDDEDDGSMIRHPTPPYTEEEMRDPIGPHVYKTPSQVTDQPLYEEDTESERSQSPIQEQPVVERVEADFPEIVTLSGGTTPSEPQSPKTFDNKKFSEAIAMDALSEHDISESSTHSPMYQDGEKVFDLPTEDPLHVQSDVLGLDLNIENVNADPTRDILDNKMSEAANQGSSREIVSDDECHSQNEKSETRSERSDVGDDEKSDHHYSDKSDHQHDGKSDFQGDQGEKRFEDDSHYDGKDDHYDGNQDKYDQGMGGYQGDQAHNFQQQETIKYEQYYKQESYTAPSYDNKTVSHQLDESEMHSYETEFEVTHSQELGQTMAMSPSKFEHANQEPDFELKSENLPGYNTSFIGEIKEKNHDLAAKEFEKEKLSNFDYEHPEDGVNLPLYKSEDSNLSEKQEIGKYQLGSDHETDSERKSYFENVEEMTNKISEIDYSHSSGNQAELSLREDVIIDSHEIISPQHMESSSVLENKYLSEVSEAHQYETLSGHEMNAYTSNVTYDSGNVIKQLTSAKIDDTTGHSNENNHYTSDILQPAVQGLATYIQEETANEGEYLQSLGHYGDSHMGSASANISYSENTVSAVNLPHDTYDTNTEYKNSSASGVSYEHEECFEKEYSLRGEQVSDNWKDGSSDFSAKFEAASATGTNIQSSYPTNEQESRYIIDSRFHSDSPEDNVMRSDSSPDVPYAPKTIGELKPTDEYANLNLTKIGGNIPSKTTVHDEDNPYDVSSEDEDSASPPGTVSPYAYTNEAYTKEEEDIDGNRIYKETAPLEQNSDILQGVDFDSNNPQNLTTEQVSYSQAYQETEPKREFSLEDWGKPMGLPTPPDAATKTASKKISTSNGKTSTASKLSSPLKRAHAKSKEPSGSPIYVDLAYVPHHGDPNYCDVEFFKKVRARYYVFSGINPSKEVLNALLEGKKTWKEDLEVTIIPTYETDTLGYWMAQNQDDLTALSIEVAASASRCTVNLQDHETRCAAYRLEF